MSDPSDARTPTIRPVEFETADGVLLAGDLALPDGPPGQRALRGGAIGCHPHPQYGGNRFDHVVTSLFRALPTIGVAALRFDFRRSFDDGVGERLDAAAALDTLADELDGEPASLTSGGSLPLVAAGYSFGAMIAASLDDPRIAACVLVAPPLAVMTPAVEPPGRGVPMLVLTPVHDQFSPPEATQPILDRWSAAGTAPIDHRTIEMADHFLHGATARVAADATTWLTRQLPGSSS